VQPFISGAISKTINLPNEASQEEIKDCYYLSWQLGLKACALYRDGSKLSQPLSNKSDKKKKEEVKEEAAEPEMSQIIDLASLTSDDLLEEVNRRVQASPDTQLKRALSHIVERKQLPAKRRGYTIKGKVGGQALFLRTGEYGDGTLGEIFIDMAKEGATMRSLLNSFAIAISVGLQYGVPLEEYVDKFAFSRFEPSGIVEHPNIKTATSVLDYIFRLLAYEYLDRDDLVHVPDPNRKTHQQEMEALQHELSQVRVTAPQAPAPKAKSPIAPVAVGAAAQSSAELKKLMGTSADAPACRNCGNITLRNGTCYMCPNCGTTTGCS